MAKLYANENFPFPAAEELHRLGHDVITVQESGLAGQSVPDDAVLRFAADQGRILITLNRRHFVKLHEQNPGHPGIIACTTDIDFIRLASQIDVVLEDHFPLAGRLVGVSRPD